MVVTSFNAWAAGVAAVANGALLVAIFSYFNELTKFKRDQLSRQNALKNSIAAEIYSNQIIVVERITNFWEAIHQDIEHIPAAKTQVLDTVYKTMHGNLGLIEPSISVQIIYFYSRLVDYVEQHRMMESYLDDDSGKALIDRPGYGTHAMFLNTMGTEIKEDALELIRLLNDGTMIGEYDVSFDPRPHIAALKGEKFQQENDRYLANRKRLDALSDFIRSPLSTIQSWFK